jgi:hypothetical protein
MTILFLESSIQPKTIDECYQSEAQAARDLGIKTIIINFEDLTSTDIARNKKAFKYIKQTETIETVIYRGWMLTPTQYEYMYQTLKSFGYVLINDSTKYQNCHYLPDSYKSIENITPKTIWFDVSELDNVSKFAECFGNNPIIIKDYVKSEKHDWDTACFVPDASDTKNLKQIISNFLELRGEYLNVGIVLREFVNLKKLTIHEKCNLQLSEEYRLFFMFGKLVHIVNYWDCEYVPTAINTEAFEAVAKNIDSNFFSMDIAKLDNGDFIIIELGDAQVSGLPDNADLNNFFKNITI